MKTSYKGYKIGDKVQLISTNYSDSVKYNIGTEIIIEKFPYCTIPGKYTNFIFGKDNKGNIVRCFVNEVKKVK